MRMHLFSANQKHVIFYVHYYSQDKTWSADHATRTIDRVWNNNSIPQTQYKIWTSVKNVDYKLLEFVYKYKRIVISWILLLILSESTPGKHCMEFPDLGLAITRICSIPWWDIHVRNDFSEIYFESQLYKTQSSFNSWDFVVLFFIASVVANAREIRLIPPFLFYTSKGPNSFSFISSFFCESHTSV